MSCTTILAGKKATADGSLIIARNDDSSSGHFTPKNFAVILPEQQPRSYTSVLSHVLIDLPDDPLRYTALPDALPGKGTWAACGANAADVGMTATETITSNARVLGADPLVRLRRAKDDSPEIPGGIGEEDLVVLVLPYIRSAREGVVRLGSLLEKYGTYETNGIAFADSEEIWWLESVGGHHWIARRVPDDRFVIMPNQLGIDSFDLNDALGEGREYLCSADLRSFIADNRLGEVRDGCFDPRELFGSHSDADHVYNTPRAWFMARFLMPHAHDWDAPAADIGPESDDIPWSGVPEKKITVEDVKYLLSSHFQGTPYDPYGSYGGSAQRGKYRSIGVNRTDDLGLIQIRPYMPEKVRTVEWLALGSNVFNALVPLYTDISAVPEYLSCTGEEVDTGSFYWSSRLIAALADAHFGSCLPHIERYQGSVAAAGHEIIDRFDRRLTASAGGGDALRVLCEKANNELADMLREKTARALDRVLFTASSEMKNAYSRSDN